ncbi:hypothetical protein B0H17DRAFT_1137472 [Mycena rosella]|uniref:Uncharacterized protein n=1 Tax=Mycena rosella TaxID=1033263 RepID=A0AAD7D8H3_MYCRO|nr:hypothetical protein B0H17DRAFT_1137472 [Mycena rosella]
MPTSQRPDTQGGRVTIYTPKWSDYAKIQMFNIFRTVACQVTVNGRNFDGRRRRNPFHYRPVESSLEASTERVGHLSPEPVKPARQARQTALCTSRLVKGQCSEHQLANLFFFSPGGLPKGDQGKTHLHNVAYPETTRVFDSVPLDNWESIQCLNWCETHSPRWRAKVPNGSIYFSNNIFDSLGMSAPTVKYRQLLLTEGPNVSLSGTGIQCSTLSMEKLVDRAIWNPKAASYYVFGVVIDNSQPGLLTLGRPKLDNDGSAGHDRCVAYDKQLANLESQHMDSDLRETSMI